MAKKAKPRARVPRRKGRTFIQRSRSVPPSAKASFHQIEGAGRSRVKRRFFGLTEADKGAIVERVRRAIQDQIKQR